MPLAIENRYRVPLGLQGPHATTAMAGLRVRLSRDELRSPCGEPAFAAGSILSPSLRVGQSRINAVGERADVVAQRLVDAVYHDRDGRQDKRIFRHRLATAGANH